MRDAKSTRVHEIRLSQPISVALQLCLVDLLKSWDITPSAVTSHSSGEIAAAYAVGILSFKEALGVVYYRGELAQRYHERLSLAGGMLAAGLSAEKAEEYLKDTSDGVVVVACHNSPDSVTLSGDLPALDEVASRLEKNGIFARKLNVPLAYHSHHMVHMAQDYTDSLKAILPATPSWTRALFASPVTGDIITSPKVLDAEHFVRNLTSPVLFSQAFENMCFSAMSSAGSPRPAGQDVNVDLIIEIGAHGTLSGPIRQILRERKIPYVSCLKRSVDAVHTMQDTACELLARGYPVSLGSVNAHENGKFVPALPSYAWNHTSAYWTESRNYREHRNKRFPPHELLGTPFSGGNPLTPTWRNFLRTSDISWLTDHQIDSEPVLPGAGYVAMAIEAVRLLMDPSEKSIHGYRLRDIDITNALTITDSSAGVETQLCLRACSEKELDYKGWYEFEFGSVSGANDSWIQHCKGYVTVETTNSTKPAVTKSEIKAPTSESFFTPGLKVASVDPESTFVGLRKMKLYHGPSFQNLISSQVAGHKSITTLAVSPAASDCDETYVLHPTTLDSIIQAFYVSIPKATQDNAMVVPRSIRSMFVPRDLKRQTGDKMRVFVDTVKADRRGAKLNAIAVNDNGDEESASFFQIEDFYCQAVALDEADAADSKVSRMCSESRWELDILHDFPASFKDSMRVNLDNLHAEFEKNLNRASYNFIYDAVAALEGAKNVESWQWYHKLFYDWMKLVIERGDAGELGPGSRNWSKTSKGLKQRLADDLEAENAAGRLTSRVGQKLASIIRGEVTSLELMMEDALLNQYYEDTPRLKRTYEHLKKVVELYGVKQPGANVLEIGGRTGGVTMRVLEGFAAKAEGGSGSLLGHYDFTDVSSELFDVAQLKFATWGGLMDFKKLDIGSDPTEQSFTASSYDFVVASGVLHATPDLNKTMMHVRKLLKSGGKLLMVETTRDRLDTQLVFGTLPGWWLSEEPARKMSPNASVETWDEVLKATGFTGVEFNIGDCEQLQFQSTSIILTTATELQPAYPSSISIVCTELSPPLQTWLKELTKAIEAQTGASVAVESLKDVQVKHDTVYIFTPEMTEPLLDSMDSSTFEKLRNLLVNGQGILWLSGSSVIDAKEPLYAQSQGLLRTMKQEDSNKRYIRLDFESTLDSPWSKDKIPHIVHVLQQSFNTNIEPSSIEWEYAVKDSMLHVPRIYPSPAQDRASSETPVEPAPELQPFWQAGRPLVWEAPKSCLLSDIYFTDNSAIADTDIPSRMVEIKPAALGLNFRDVMVALGQLDETLIGHECSGIITGLGPDTEQSGLKVGDRVCGTMRGRFGSTTRTFWTNVTKIPDDMSWEDAASIPLIFLTSYIALFEIARLEKGERVLIHAGTGGVGQSATMLAQYLGAEVFVTCSTEAKRDLLIEQYHLDPDHILSSRDASFAQAIMAMTDGEGVDVVLNSLSGPLLKVTWDCMAHFGRFVEIGKVDIEAARRLDMTPFGRSASIAGLDLFHYCEYKGKVVQKVLKEIIRLCHEKAIKPVYPVTSYSISDMETAMRQMQRGTHIGKLVLVPGPDDEVKVVSRSHSLSLDGPESTYMIAGGLGGIGHAIALSMIEKGAKNILITSRSAVSHPNAAGLAQRAKADGCNVYVRNCDISNEESLVKLLTDCAGTMPPIRGVIQAAMHLDVSYSPGFSKVVIISDMK
jgi:NADPH:quinone reductase-like Zn-dependent oxidoreductase/malonyl CoA-acyl carrier protein transacylase/ubiquinone/menaquinone biosynthesis C-methylase UbiE